MSYREALKTFNLNDLYTENELKKEYNKLIKKFNSRNIDNDELNKINNMYAILLNELKKRNVKETIDNILSNINKLKEKYPNTKIYDTACLYENKLNNIDNIIDIKVIKDEFNQKISSLKKEIIVPQEKDKILKNIYNYNQGYSNEIKVLSNSYIDLINKSNSLEELNSLNQKYLLLLNDELKMEKKRIKELEILKDSLKKSHLYYFNQNIRNKNIDYILLAHYVLIASLKLINVSNLETKDDIFKLISKIDYENIQEDYNIINSFIEKNNLIELPILTTKEKDIKKSNNSNELINIVLNKYYLYSIKNTTTIDKLIKDDVYFNELFTLLKILKFENVNLLINQIKDINYKNIKIFFEARNDFLNVDMIHIERETGNLCVFKSTGKKIYTIFLDGKIKNDLNSFNDIIWKYIPLTKFFKVSYYSNGLEINEVFFDKTNILGDYDTNYLYYTPELLLCIIDNDIYKEFKFLPAKDDSKFQKSNDKQITRHSYFEIYKDKDKCLNDLIKYINTEKLINNNQKVFEKI